MRYTTTDGPNKTLSAIHDGAQGAKMGNADQNWVKLVQRKANQPAATNDAME